MIDAVYEASPLKRRRMTKAEIKQLEAQILDVLAEDNPQSVRHVFYRMTDPRLPVPIEKTEAGYDQVQRRMVEMRRSGTLPHGDIVDHTWSGYHTPTFSCAEDFVRRMAGYYRVNLWAQSDWHREVWAESRSIAGVLQEDCEDLAVSLYPRGGFSSLSLAYEAAEQMRQQGKPVKIFYIGDYDPAGVLIDVALEHELRKHLIDWDLDFRRIAITKEQIAEYDLPGKPRKEGDRRARREAEAMPAAILRQMVREHVEALLPPSALEITKVAEESERSYF